MTYICHLVGIKWHYKDGSFTKDETMEQMIETCVPFVSKGNPWPEEKWTPNRQAEYIKSVLSELENSFGEDFVSKIMYPCGGQCLSNGVIEKAKTAYGKSENLEDFLNKLNEQHWRKKNYDGVTRSYSNF